MDTAAIEAAGTAPLKPYLAEINGAKTRSQLLSLFIKPGYEARSTSDRPEFQEPRRLRGVLRPGDARIAEPRILSRRQCEDEGASRRLSRLYRDDREACRPAGRRSGRRPHHRAGNGLVEGPVAGRRPARHRQDLQPDDACAAHEAGAAVRLDRDARQGGPRPRQEDHRHRAVGSRRRRQDPGVDAAFDLEGMARIPLRVRPCGVLPKAIDERASPSTRRS